jgi:hypothetical protein
MANYKNIKGFSIQYLDSDPPNPIEGQIWFNSTSGTFKGLVPGGIAAGTWASVTSLNTARGQLTGDGTQNAAFAVCGYGATDVVGNFELYNGSSWTETTDVNTARRNAGSFGTQTSALIFNGQAPAVTAVVEQWNGSAWTEVAEMNTNRIGISMTGCGVSGTSGIQGGGFAYPGPMTANTETWNGSAWTEVNEMNTARQQHGQNGTQTAAITAGGGPGYLNVVEVWDGTNWTEVGEINTGRVSASLSGSSTLSLYYGGDNGSYLTNTEAWDGSAWTEVADIATARGDATRAGSGNTLALMAGGWSPSPNSAAEEWNAPPIAIKTFTTS